MREIVILSVDVGAHSFHGAKHSFFRPLEAFLVAEIVGGLAVLRTVVYSPLRFVAVVLHEAFHAGDALGLKPHEVHHAFLAAGVEVFPKRFAGPLDWVDFPAANAGVPVEARGVLVGVGVPAGVEPVHVGHEIFLYELVQRPLPGRAVLRGGAVPLFDVLFAGVGVEAHGREGLDGVALGVGSRHVAFDEPAAPIVPGLGLVPAFVGKQDYQSGPDLFAGKQRGLEENVGLQDDASLPFLPFEPGAKGAGPAKSYEYSSLS